MLRQIILDTETTGLSPEKGDRIIEIGCIEMLGRRLTRKRFHVYINPERDIEHAAQEVHGITREFLADKPKFIDIVEEFVEFIRDAELIIHNAPFDVGFINHEFKLTGKPYPTIDKMCGVIDTLALARRKYPGQQNSLDALCRRYGVDNSNRELHGALLDAELLSQVYLLLTGGQEQLFSLESSSLNEKNSQESLRRLSVDRPPLRVVRANMNELVAHQAFLEKVLCVDS